MDKNQKGWLTSKLEDAEFRGSFERELVEELTLSQIEHAMIDKGLIGKVFTNEALTKLAKRMDCSLVEISRVLKMPSSMTIAMLVKMGLSLNLRVKIELEPIEIKESEASREQDKPTAI